jgi:hypothetical protein
MNYEEDIKLRLEEIKGFMYSEINRLILENLEKESTKANFSRKYKPTKHQMAYRAERISRKRHYVR